ncbi:predicted protein [Chaetoceros tenuissimus]|uniref:Uncharacterized protein n=1 Tax=Chaetoceros tenuissimus TaxID=426638 RepID=A0AAD3CG12_9STRA|nr:predicted protein [Chaetoceros tenuissimus]
MVWFGFYKDVHEDVAVPFSNALFTQLNALGISGEGNKQSIAPFVVASKECSDFIFLDADICTNDDMSQNCKDTRTIEYKYTSVFDEFGKKAKTKKIKRTVCVDGCFEGDTMSPIEEEEYLALAQITMDQLCDGETDIEVTAKFVKTKADKCYPAISDKYAKKKCKGTKAAKGTKTPKGRTKSPKGGKGSKTSAPTASPTTCNVDNCVEYQSCGVCKTCDSGYFISSGICKSGWVYPN